VQELLCLNPKPVQELLDLMTEIMQSEKKDQQKDKDKGKDKTSKDSLFEHETSMTVLPGEVHESVRPSDGSEDPLGIDTAPRDAQDFYSARHPPCKLPCQGMCTCLCLLACN